MNELIILSFDTQADADRARRSLQTAAADGIVVLPDLDTAALQVAQREAQPATGLRRWAVLPWRVGSKVMGGALMAVTWTSLIIGTTAGELAGRLLGHDEKDGLRQQVAQAVQPDKVPVIVLAQGQTPVEWLEDLAESQDQVYRTRVSAETAARLQSAFGSD